MLAVVAALLFVGGLLLGTGGHRDTVPRLLHLGLRPDTVYPLYGVHYWVQRTIAR